VAEEQSVDVVAKEEAPKVEEVTLESLKLRVDIEELTVDDMITLEEIQKTAEIVAWCVKHAGADEAQLRKLKARHLLVLSKDLAAQIQRAMQAPN
jgi:hypothetical protein